jgi:serine/threonine-protein kinase ATR
MEKVVALLKTLLKTDGSNVEEYAVALNIPNRPELREICDVIQSRRCAVPPKERLQRWIDKAYDGDVNDVEVALRSIYAILTTKDRSKEVGHLDGYHDWLKDDQRNDLYTLLLELCQRRISIESVQVLIAKCLGAIGATDPKRVDVWISDHRFVMMENFVDMDENRAFALHIVQNYLYRALLESQNGNIQRRVQFSIQTLLRYCGLTAESDGPNTVQQLWNGLSPEVRAAVAPLLTSKLACNWTWQHNFTLIYPTAQTFEQWLIDWTMSLITSSRTEAYTIFNGCSPLILTRNIAIATHLIPHLVLYLVISGKGNVILKEILSVLEPTVIHSEEKRQACLQVSLGDTRRHKAMGSFHPSCGRILTGALLNCTL